jgi:hypothetical protein
MSLFFLKRFPDHWLSKSLSPDLLSLKKRLDMSLLNVEVGTIFGPASSFPRLRLGKRERVRGKRKRSQEG